MKKALLGMLLGALGWQAFTDYRAHATGDVEVIESDDETESGSAPDAEREDAFAPSADFHCDGRKYCSEMTSCDEAKYFLANCPGVKMDGRGGGPGPGDGVPCERQWCTD